MLKLSRTKQFLKLQELVLVIEKSNVLYVEEECEMLAQVMCELTFSFSLNIKFRHFYI
jgi:hypothetical protein